jgi:hypothetical protein
MKKATRTQIIEVAKKHDAIGHNGTCLYGVTNGIVTKYAASLYRDSLSILCKEGVLKYNDNFTYSI